MIIKTAIDKGREIGVTSEPRRIIGEQGKVKGIELHRCLSLFDKTGRFCPCFDGGTIRVLEGGVRFH